MRTHNVRHDIAPALVAAQMDARIAELEANRVRLKDCAAKALASYEAASDWPGRKPDGPEAIDPLIDARIAKELDHYARVRIIELPQDGERFILVYGDEDDMTVGSGTGPFESIAQASAWFTRGGR